MLTAEEIANKCESKEGIANIRCINKLYRVQDESKLYPIFNKFNVTERAIRKARKFAVLGLEYSYLLDSLIADIINNPNY